MDSITSTLDGLAGRFAELAVKESALVENQQDLIKAREDLERTSGNLALGDKQYRESLEKGNWSVVALERRGKAMAADIAEVRESLLVATREVLNAIIGAARTQHRRFHDAVRRFVAEEFSAIYGSHREAEQVIGLNLAQSNRFKTATERLETTLRITGIPRGDAATVEVLFDKAKKEWLWALPYVQMGKITIRIHTEGDAPAKAGS